MDMLEIVYFDGTNENGDGDSIIIPEIVLLPVVPVRLTPLSQGVHLRDDFTGCWCLWLMILRSTALSRSWLSVCLPTLACSRPYLATAATASMMIVQRG